MAIDRNEFAQVCVEEGRRVGVNPHVLVAIADLLSGINDDTQGNRIGPFRRTTTEWNANGSEPRFDVQLQPQHIHQWEMQCIFAALMTYRAQESLLASLGRYPSADELYARWPGEPLPAGKAMQGALDATSALMDPAVDAALAGLNNGLVAHVNLQSVPAGRRDIATMITSAFAHAGYGRFQQVAALANAIAESALNPNAQSPPPEDSVGLFQLNRGGGVGTGHSREHLRDPQINIGLIIREARTVPAFANATSLHDAVAVFVRKVERPANAAGEIIKRLKIAETLLA